MLKSKPNRILLGLGLAHMMGILVDNLELNLLTELNNILDQFKPAINNPQ